MSLEQLDRAVRAIESDQVPRPEAVYSLRKRCKKVRAILRLARGPLEDLDIYRPANATLRDIAARFSGLRDADVMLATYDRVMARCVDTQQSAGDRRRFAPIRAALTRRRTALLARPENNLGELLEEARWLLLKFRLGIGDWDFEDSGFQAIDPGLRKTYRRVLSSAKQARKTGSVEALHEWRKRLKYHRNHLRLLRKMAPRTLLPRIKALWQLGDLLGFDRDLAILHDLVSTDPAFSRIAAQRDFLKLADAFRREIQARALQANDALAFTDEDTTISRLAGLWNIGMNRPVAASGMDG